ncbi:MAG: hypothetical protein H0V44_04620 [Planctomycetes bacterium]|nr:hypothetical protein [Planctomycetota bacterium]
MRTLLIVLVLACSLASTACYGNRKPIPVVTVAVLAEDDAFQLNGQQMNGKQLAEELRQIAQHNRREKTDNSRAVVRIASRPGANYDRLRAVEELCHSLGLDKIEKGM